MEMLDIGKKYGCLTTLKYEGKGKHREPRYLCRCDCGNVDSFNMSTWLLNRTHCTKCATRGGSTEPVILHAGEKYGHLTVIDEAPQKKTGGRRYFCKCDCGYIDSYPASVIKKMKNSHCRKCVPHQGGYPEPDLAGQVINGWDVIEEVSREPNPNGNGLKYLYRCRCLRCGNESFRTSGEIRNKKGDRCENCPPMYHFVIDGNTAVGTLPDGSAFIIDKEDIHRVNQYYWNKDHEGYIIARCPNGEKHRLHRFILGVDNDTTMVDHINRNRGDNRKANLRVISTFGNTCNHSKLSSNKTGYIGVYYAQSRQRYEVKVGYHRKRILLGSSKDDLIKLAQMYNVAAQYLFGEFVGELNDVPEPSQEIIDAVIRKSSKYKEAPAPIQMVSDAFHMEVA